MIDASKRCPDYDCYVDWVRLTDFSADNPAATAETGVDCYGKSLIFGY